MRAFVVHIFESGFEDNDPYNRVNLFEVMAGQDKAYYESPFGLEFKSTPHGIMGLATTALNKKYPVPLFRTGVEGTGLLMDTAKPLFVGSHDRYSIISGNKMRFKGAEEVLALAVIQGFEKSTDGLGYDMNDDLNGRSDRANKALSALWDHIAEVGWKEYISTTNGSYNANPGMNEVNVVAQLQNVCGIVVNAAHRDKAQAIEDALLTKEYLLTTHPEIFDASLPIYMYEISRDLHDPKPRLVEMKQKDIDQLLGGGHSL